MRCFNSARTVLSVDPSRKHLANVLKETMTHECLCLQTGAVEKSHQCHTKEIAREAGDTNKEKARAFKNNINIKNWKRNETEETEIKPAGGFAALDGGAIELILVGNKTIAHKRRY